MDIFIVSYHGFIASIMAMHKNKKGYIIWWKKCDELMIEKGDN